MAVTTNVEGNWKTAQGTLSEILGQLNSDNVKKEKVEFAFDSGSGNYTALYYIG